MTVPTVSQSTIPTLPDRYNVSTILDSNLEGGRGAKVALRGAAGEATYQRLFDDWEMLEPGVTPVSGWRPDEPIENPEAAYYWAGVARKP